MHWGQPGKPLLGRDLAWQNKTHAQGISMFTCAGRMRAAGIAGATCLTPHDSEEGSQKGHRLLQGPASVAANSAVPGVPRHLSQGKTRSVRNLLIEGEDQVS